ncbi:MAG: ornithine carbamoyltransferase [Beijerinckiaceae bacterium]
MARHFLDLSDIPADQLRLILNNSRAMKDRRRTKAAAADQMLAGKKIAMVFEQPSLRTRISFEVGIRELGGDPLMITGKEIELGEREAISDQARVLSRYVDAIMIRSLKHELVVELAKYATVPVINGLTKRSHPCQVMADIMTFEEHRGDIRGKTIAWCGDSNNVLASLMHAAQRFEFRLNVATPPELKPTDALLDWVRRHKADIHLTSDPFEAADNADCIVSDAWVSMGDKDEGRRHNLLKPYQVNERLMAAASKDALFMHCLPAHRGEEVTDAVLDGPQSVVLDEAENRLHAQKGILAWVFETPL